MKLHFSDAIGLFTKTLPFIIARGTLYLVFALFAAIYFAILLWFISLFKNAGGIAAVIFIGGTIGFYAIARVFTQYVLYLLKVAHIAVISIIISEGKLPDGISQLEYGKKYVTDKFKDVSILFVADQMVIGVLRAFHRTAVAIEDMIPIPGLDGVTKLLNTLVDFAVTCIVEAILSYTITRKEDNLWAGARDGTILYVQSWKNILFNSAIFGLINAVAFIIFFLVFSGPLALMFTNKSLALILAAILAYTAKKALINPLAMCSIILTFHEDTQGKTPSPEWKERLETISQKFVELEQKAATFVSGKKPA